MSEPPLSIDSMLASGNLDDWQTVRELITSQQIGAQRIAEIEREYPAFAAWMARHSPRPGGK